jgi:16S rRNA (cytosine967-C5)-methyltransferase
LAFGPQMDNLGQIYLHDIRKEILYEARRRLNRAGLQNVQFLPSGSPGLKTLKGKMHWILTDVPCTGTGTLRRSPDLKWRMEPDVLSQLVQKQRLIFHEAFPYLHPHGKIVYTTCSVLREENQDQMEYFRKEFDLEVEEPIFQTLPTRGGMDGFFGVVFRRKKKST